MTTATRLEGQRSFRRNRLLHALAGAYLAWWIVLAIAPYNRQDWLLENLLVFASAGVLIGTYRRFAFSDLSYLLLAVFFTLHTVGAHYTYSEVPLGHWIKDQFGLSRNHFDRVIHFSFGLLVGYPLRELLCRRAGLRGLWSYVLPLAVVMAFSEFFEILEALTATVVSPELGAAYLGTQGDIWDAQKDSALAALGGLICVSAIAAFRRKGV
jgi:putative membrane protein